MRLAARLEASPTLSGLLSDLRWPSTTFAGNDIEGVLCVGQPWPGIARSIWGDHGRYMDTYLKPYPGLYFTGDGCRRDKDG